MMKKVTILSCLRSRFIAAIACYITVTARACFVEMEYKQLCLF